MFKRILRPGEQTVMILPPFWATYRQVRPKAN